MGSFPAACCVNYSGFVLQLNKIPRSHEVGGEPKRDSLLRGSLFQKVSYYSPQAVK
jgi:hypothetical protein